VSSIDGINNNGSGSNGSATSDNNICSGSGREKNELWVKIESCVYHWSAPV